MISFFEEIPDCLQRYKDKKQWRDWCCFIPWVVSKCIVQCPSSWQAMLFQLLIGCSQATRELKPIGQYLSPILQQHPYSIIGNYVYPCWCWLTRQDHRFKSGYGQPNMIRCYDWLSTISSSQRRLTFACSKSEIFVERMSDSMFNKEHQWKKVFN